MADDAPTTQVISKQDDSGRVYVTDEYGQVGSVNRDELNQAVASGLRPSTAQEVAGTEAKAEAETALGYAQTAGLGAARGATFGLSDVLVEQMGGAEKARELQALNPLTSGVGEVTGAVLPALFTGGTSAGVSAGTRGAGMLSRVARFTPTGATARLGAGLEQAAGRQLTRLGVTGESLAGRMLQRGTQLGVSGAAEGALYGAGMGLSEAALSGGDYDRLAERMLAGGWQGLKEGAVLGGALGAGLGAGGKALDRFGSVGLPGGADFAESQAMRALGARASDLKRLQRKGGFERVGRELLDAKLDDGTKVLKAGDTTEQIAAKIDTAIDQSMTKLDDMRTKIDEITRKSPELAPDGADLFRRVDELVAREGTTPTLAKRWRKASSELEPLREAIDPANAVQRADGTVAYPLSFKDLNAYRKKIDRVIFPKGGAGVQVAPKSAEQLLALRQELETVISESAERALKESGSEMAGQYGKMKQRVSGLIDAKKIAARDEALDLAASPFGITEKLTAMGGVVTAAASGSLLPLAAGAAISGGKKLLRERGFSVIARMADDAAKSERSMSKSLKNFFKGTDISPARRHAIGVLAARKDDDRTPAEKALGTRRGEDKIKAYSRKVKSIRDFQANPIDSARERLGDLGGEAPNTTVALSAAVARGQEFLASKIPTPPSAEGTLFPAIDTPEPSGEELAKFARYVEAVEKPLSVLEHLSNGTITAEHVEALQAVYPKLYEDMRGHVQDQLVVANERGKKLPYDSRVLLGVLLDMPTDPSLRPEEIRASQAGYATASEAAPPPPAASAVAPDIGKKLRSPAQALEAGEFDI